MEISYAKSAPQGCREYGYFCGEITGVTTSDIKPDVQEQGTSTEFENAMKNSESPKISGKIGKMCPKISGNTQLQNSLAEKPKDQMKHAKTF